MKKLTTTIALSSAMVMTAYAGGDPEYVSFPEDYKENFTHYATINRMNGKQVAALYANEAAMGSIRYGDKLVPGSRIVMEIYKIKKDTDGNPIQGPDGVYERGLLAAIAVTEKSLEWPAGYPVEHRAGDWGFALYTPTGQPKENSLDCASCHLPLADTDYLFTHKFLKQAARK